jgi:ANTAR domain
MDADQAQHGTAAGSPDGVVVRRSRRGWQVGDEEAADLTSAMALADLLAAELGLPADGSPGSQRSGAPGPGAGDGEAVRLEPARLEAAQLEAAQLEAAQLEAARLEAARLAVTVAQLEHALAARVRVEQAIGVLAERHRLRPRQAFDLLRNVARSSGQKVVEIAGTVVDSASNPLLPLPEELARTPAPGRSRGPSPRQVRAASEPG